MNGTDPAAGDAAASSAPVDDSTAAAAPDTVADGPSTATGTAAAAAAAATTTTTTPGGYATRLRAVFERALAHTLGACSWASFAACFPTAAARRPDVLQAVWRQVVGKIEAKALAEFDGIMAERDAVAALNELEALIAEARARMKGDVDHGNGDGRGDVGATKRALPPHLLPPQDLHAAHLAPELEPIAASLRAQVDAVSADNERLAAGVAEQRVEVDALVGRLEAVVRDLEAANETLADVVSTHALRQDTLDVHRELNEAETSKL